MHVSQESTFVHSKTQLRNSFSLWGRTRNSSRFQHEIRRAFTTVGLGIEGIDMHRTRLRGSEAPQNCLIERCGLQHELILAQ